MAKINQGILGGIIGSIANLIGSSWRGIVYIRSKPTNYHDPKTALQVYYRSRFGACSHLAKTLVEPAIRKGWDPFVKQMSGYNHFISTNSEVFNSQGGIDDYSKLVISWGNLPLPSDIMVTTTKSKPNEVKISWVSNDLPPEEDPSDLLNVIRVFQNEASVIDTGNATRRLGEANCKLIWGNEKFAHLYIYFTNESQTRFSNSFYAFVQG